MNRDEKLLKEMLSEKLDKDFESQFWKEFNTNHKRKKERSFIWAYPALAACLLVFLSYNVLVKQNKPMDASIAMIDLDLMQDYDMLAELDERMIDLDQSEWELLLAEN